MTLGMSLWLAALPTLAHAITMNLVSTTTITSAISVDEYRLPSPGTDLYVARINLCTQGIYLDADRFSTTFESTGTFASGIGATLAVNGDFYATGPTRVYGEAMGGGVRWPTLNSGAGTEYNGEWYYGDYGWIGFAHDAVVYTHAGWVKDNAAQFGGNLGGWSPATKRPTPPPGMLAIASGFPEVVVEGQARTCSSPTASSCFPERSDMRARHPRTAIGVTQDLQTLFLVVADGRTSSNAGLYGSELADVMGQLGAYEAFNLDGGGSSQMWASGGRGYLNDVNGNNYGSGTRSVLNHWGVQTQNSALRPSRPGHCVTASPCGVLPPAGGTIDDSDLCARRFGAESTWRPVSVGVGGSGRWTNAFASDAPDNWAWWRLDFEQAGTYQVEVSTDPTYSIHNDVRYEIRHDGTSTFVEFDPTGPGQWKTLGTWDFAAGPDQWVAFYDDETSSPGSNQHIFLDAVRVTRVGGWCGDATCDAGEACACTSDCPVVAEVPGNGADDDCDGTVDETPPPPDTPDPPPDTPEPPSDTPSDTRPPDPADTPSPGDTPGGGPGITLPDSADPDRDTAAGGGPAGIDPGGLIPTGGTCSGCDATSPGPTAGLWLVAWAAARRRRTGP